MIFELAAGVRVALSWLAWAAGPGGGSPIEVRPWGDAGWLRLGLGRTWRELWWRGPQVLRQDPPAARSNHRSAGPVGIASPQGGCGGRPWTRHG